MEDIDSETYEAAVARWGVHAQVLMCVEEVGELLQALSKYDRERTMENRHDIIEELVDVTIMVEQMRVIFDDCNISSVPIFEDIRTKKMQRLRKLVMRDTPTMEA